MPREARKRMKTMPAAILDSEEKLCKREKRHGVDDDNKSDVKTDGLLTLSDQPAITSPGHSFQYDENAVCVEGVNEMGLEVCVGTTPSREQTAVSTSISSCGYSGSSTSVSSCGYSGTSASISSCGYSEASASVSSCGYSGSSTSISSCGYSGSSAIPDQEAEPQTVIIMHSDSSLLEDTESGDAGHDKLTKAPNSFCTSATTSDLSRSADVVSHSSHVVLTGPSRTLIESHSETDRPVRELVVGESSQYSETTLVEMTQPQEYVYTSASTEKMGDNVQTFVATLPSENFLSCGICGMMFSSDGLVKQHMEEMHGLKEEINHCDVCSLVFPSKRTLLVHLKTKHKADDLTCQICGKKFQCQRYLSTHLQRHAGVKKFECSFCGWRFFERHKLKFHMELHKEESERCLPYRCELCGKQFINKASWSDHCNTHSGHRPFACDKCEAKFAHRMVCQHIDIDNPLTLSQYTTPVRPFTGGVGLRRHKLTHEKVKPFSCNICSRTFTVKPKLDEHMTTHTGVSRHTCHHCSKVFTAASSLKRHMTKCSIASAFDHQPDLNSDSSTQNPDTTGLSNIPSSSKFVFMCGSCDTYFETYSEAEQHASTHVIGNNSQDCTVTDGSGVSTSVISGTSVLSSGVVFDSSGAR